MKLILVLLLAVSAGIAGFVWWGKSEQSSLDGRLARTGETIMSPQTDIPSNEGSPVSPESVHPLSLEMLFEKEFDGRDLELVRILESNASYTRHYITYKSDDLTISGIMNIPKGTPPEGGFPVLILNHGYIDPAIYTNGRGLRREQDYLARAGFAVLHPDYRGHAESSTTDEDTLAMRIGYVEDVINAVYAVREARLPQINPEKIGMLGHSMGGGITQSIAVAKPDLALAYVLYAPVSMDYRDSYERWISRRPEAVTEIVEKYGSPETQPQFWDEISALSFVDRITRPILLFHGTEDESVPIAWSEETAALLRARGKSIEYIVYPGERHEYSFRWGDFMARTRDFFQLHLGSGA